MEDIQSDVLDKDEIKEPGMYKVIMLNDDISTMELVVYILMDIFGKDKKEAYTIMMNIHKKQRGIAGIYTKDIALSKCNLANETARQNGFPLKCVVEKE